ncbi:hypothetical protein FDP22_12665 [Paroceanicella profunda]|uniref:Uncharacterized protein n=1 Tax=Paroceanicella profunda TaxID=2579971 RepID=A0A5B8FYT8_9RHOB|nr:hypothetical protein [Paroceanicella profunda]QDL92560.1 hypothetical protein FDP22_12665 [Paroceanicella profunda]
MKRITQCAKLAMLLGATVLMSSCGKSGSEPVCPSLVPYSPEVQEQALRELRGLPPGSVLPRFLDDYGVMRAEVRACRGESDL